MRKLIFSFGVMLVLSFNIQAQSTAEDEKNVIKVDIENGTISGLKPSSSMADIKKSLPDFSGETEENQGINCDGGVFYLDKDLFFYTYRDFVEIRSNFDGKLSKDILNKNITEVTKILGTPDHQVKPSGDDESIMVLYFKRDYGCLRLNYTIATGNVFQVAIHSKPITEAMLDLCF